ncbi:unnamed protein product [Dibothriocephalus latus]|uniref:Lipid-binding serum glycoprotein N-terminal domain-containing protein n=1 Tax=Dibothriocephalus latus TaxID=60516 RepID=A0A3P7KWB3_DIBLA|nr:unnamed protein product [Dibothriocephalus latus]
MLNSVIVLLLVSHVALAEPSAAVASDTKDSATEASVKNTSITYAAHTNSSVTACTDCLNFLLEYLMDVLTSLLPEPFIVNKSPDGFLTVKDAKVFGLKSLQRNCPTDMRSATASNAEEISIHFCVTPSEDITAVGLVKVWDLIWENPFEMATLTLHNLSVTLNLTVRFPTYLDNTTESIIKLSGVHDIETDGITVKALDERNEYGPIAVFGSTITTLAQGPLTIFFKSHLAKIIEELLRKVNRNIERTLFNVA